MPHNTGKRLILQDLREPRSGRWQAPDSEGVAAAGVLGLRIRHQAIGVGKALIHDRNRCARARRRRGWSIRNSKEPSLAYGLGQRRRKEKASHREAFPFLSILHFISEAQLKCAESLPVTASESAQCTKVMLTWPGLDSFSAAEPTGRKLACLYRLSQRRLKASPLESRRIVLPAGSPRFLRAS